MMEELQDVISAEPFSSNVLFGNYFELRSRRGGILVARGNRESISSRAHFHMHAPLLILLQGIVLSDLGLIN